MGSPERGGLPVDRSRAELNLFAELPARLSDLLFRFLHRNAGSLVRHGGERRCAARIEDGMARVEEFCRETLADILAGAESVGTEGQLAFRAVSRRVADASRERVGAGRRGRHTRSSVSAAW